MTTQTHRITVRGQKLTTRTERRYIAVAVRETPYVVPADHPLAQGEARTFVAFAEVAKRSDSLATARKAAAARRSVSYRVEGVVIDLLTGEEV